MCTAAEPASQGHDSGAGAGSHGATASAMRPAPADTATVSRRLSALALTSAFHPACSSAAPSTASVTGSEISTPRQPITDRKSTRLNSSHLVISYAVFCLKKKKKLTLTHHTAQ